MMRTSFLAAAAVLSVYALGCTINPPDAGRSPSASSGTSGTSGTSSSSSSSSGTSGNPTPTAGNVPAELVAVWKGNEETIELRADGTVGRAFRGGSTCTFKSIENGTASADGTTLTLTFTTGSFVDCTGPSDTPYQPTTEVFAYVLKSGGAVLELTTETCATGACTNGYDKH